jgi:predicted enzyme related to lactoylglutathione lyase
VRDGGRSSVSTPGLMVCVMVDSLAGTIDTAVTHGGTLVQPTGADAPEFTARVLDPGGNIIGLYQNPA